MNLISKIALGALLASPALAGEHRGITDRDIRCAEAHERSVRECVGKEKNGACDKAKADRARECREGKPGKDG